MNRTVPKLGRSFLMAISVLRMVAGLARSLYHLSSFLGSTEGIRDWSRVRALSSEQALCMWLDRTTILRLVLERVDGETSPRQVFQNNNSTMAEIDVPVPVQQQPKQQVGGGSSSDARGFETGGEQRAPFIRQCAFWIQKSSLFAL
jgi:hypothetical protein